MSGRGEGSFTERVLAELAPHLPLLACCRSALVEGMGWVGRPASGARRGGGSEDELLVTSRPIAARVALGSLHANGAAARVVRRRSPRRPSFAVLAPPGALAGPPPSNRPCCARAALRGAVLAGASLSRPDRPPHLEIRVTGDQAAAELCAVLDGFGVAAARLRRAEGVVVTVRSIEGVAAVLSSVGAQDGRLRFEEGRVVREVRAGVNRRLNGETANLRRVVAAGVRQVRAAGALEGDPEAWSRLPAALREAAALRLRHPQDSLGRLAARAGTSRSAMAGRLHRLVALAEPAAAGADPPAAGAEASAPAPVARGKRR